MKCTAAQFEAFARYVVPLIMYWEPNTKIIGMTSSEQNALIRQFRRMNTLIDRKFAAWEEAQNTIIGPDRLNDDHIWARHSELVVAIEKWRDENADRLGLPVAFP